LRTASVDVDPFTPARVLVEAARLEHADVSCLASSLLIENFIYPYISLVSLTMENREQYICSFFLEKRIGLNPFLLLHVYIVRQLLYTTTSLTILSWGLRQSTSPHPLQFSGHV
jgi:hypothetical protein